MVHTTWNTIVIVGVGLIGGSLGMALRRSGQVGRVVGVGRDPSSLDQALRRGAIDDVALDATDVAEAELAVICTPVDTIASIATRLLTNTTAIVTDCGSVKGAIIDEVLQKVDPTHAARFVPGHPLAGSDRTGVSHAAPDLFRDRICVLTPTAATDPAALEQVEQLWRTVGAVVRRLPAAEHDRWLAYSSHLPHAVAAALVNALPHEAEPWVASGFLDTTRVAASSEELWAPILQLNRQATLEALEAFLQQIEQLRAALTHNDARQLRQWWHRARSRRESLDAHRPGDDTQ